MLTHCHIYSDKLILDRNNQQGKIYDNETVVQREILKIVPNNARMLTQET
jgi:hypothetical protein